MRIARTRHDQPSLTSNRVRDARQSEAEASQGKEGQLGDVIRAGEEGMLGYAESLVDLHNKGLISEETGCLAAPNKEEFLRLLAGISTSKVQFFGG